jgi:selT/selW/selH-like putative selenoprotein
LAAEIRAKYPDAKVDLLQGSGGAFEVNRDGVPVFSKKKEGRHAEPGEILALLEEAKPSP